MSGEEEQEKNFEQDEEEEGESESIEVMSQHNVFANASLQVDKISAEEGRLDQIFYFMSLALVFSHQTEWSQIKSNLLTCSLSAIAAMKSIPVCAEDKLFTLNVSEPVISGQEELKEDQKTVKGRQRALSDITKLDALTDSLKRLRPLLVMLSLVDLIKITWDGKIQASISEEAGKSIQAYHEVLQQQYLCKGNLRQIVDDSNMFYKVFSERITKIESIEGFIDLMGLKDQVLKEFGSIEKFVLSHF